MPVEGAMAPRTMSGSAEAWTARAAAPAASPDRSPTLEQLAQALETTFRFCPELPVLAIRWMHLKHPLHEVQERLLHGTETDDRRGAEQTESGGWWVSRWIRPLLLRRL